MNVFRKRSGAARWVVLNMSMALLAACSSMPRSAPSGAEIRANAVNAKQASINEKLPYAIVKLLPSIAPIANRPQAVNYSSLQDLPSRRNLSDVRIGVSDIIGITIFESAAGGLFIPADGGARNGNFVQIPYQQVDSAGTIDVPYAGSVKVSGRSTHEVGAEIAKRLANRAIEPQVVVSIVERRGAEVSLLGEVNTPQRLVVDPGGINLLSAIARAGGPKNPEYETVVSVQRGNTVYKSYLSAVVQNPRLNVGLALGDVVYLSREPRYVMVFGATPETSGQNTRRMTFENDEMTLAEGLAKAGGMLSDRADLKSVFVFRNESRKRLAELGVDVSKYTTEQVSTVYMANLDSADGFFLTNHFKLRNRDIVVVSESPSVNYLRFITLLNETSYTPTSVVIATK